LSRILRSNEGNRIRHSRNTEGGTEAWEGRAKRRSRATKWPAALAALCALLLLFAGGCKDRAGASGNVMATVNGRKLLASEVEKYYRNQTQGQAEPSTEQAQALRLNIVHQLIDNQILLQRAEKLGLLATDADVDARLNEMKAPFTKEEFDKRLSEQGITLEDLRQDLRQQIAVEKVMKREITAKVKVSDDDVAHYYEQHKAEFNVISPRYHLAQILVTTQPSPQVRTKRERGGQEGGHVAAQAAKRRRLCQAGDEL
jgi:peptidyl-prolyl cis-trans isomerase SurA